MFGTPTLSRDSSALQVHQRTTITILTTPFAVHLHSNDTIFTILPYSTTNCDVAACRATPCAPFARRRALPPPGPSARQEGPPRARAGLHSHAPVQGRPCRGAQGRKPPHLPQVCRGEVAAGARARVRTAHRCLEGEGVHQIELPVDNHAAGGLLRAEHLVRAAGSEKCAQSARRRGKIRSRNRVRPEPSQP